VADEVGGHLVRRLEEELVGVELPVVRVLERVAGLDAEERLVGSRVLVPQVVTSPVATSGRPAVSARVRGRG
jgi:hypothetical protein